MFLPTTNPCIQFNQLTLFSQAQRSPEEEGDYLVFEQLVAEAAIKKEDESKRKKEKKGKEPKHAAAAAAAADAPNVPKA